MRLMRPHATDVGVELCFGDFWVQTSFLSGYVHSCKSSLSVRNLLSDLTHTLDDAPGMVDICQKRYMRPSRNGRYQPKETKS